ncbi:MAG: ATP-binding protein, partial [Streptosporangiaceae bacterium]
TGKTHIAQSLGQLAIRRGFEVKFEHTNPALRHLHAGRATNLWDRRLNDLAKPAVLIFDAFAVREFTPTETEDLYELMIARKGKPMIITSARAPKEWYKLFPNKVIAESFLDSLVNTSHHILMDGISYRTNKRPGRASATAPAETSQAVKRARRAA